MSRYKVILSKEGNSHTGRAVNLTILERHSAKGNYPKSIRLEVTARGTCTGYIEWPTYDSAPWRAVITGYTLENLTIWLASRRNWPPPDVRTAAPEAVTTHDAPVIPNVPRIVSADIRIYYQGALRHRSSTTYKLLRLAADWGIPVAVTVQADTETLTIVWGEYDRYATLRAVAGWERLEIWAMRRRGWPMPLRLDRPARVLSDDERLEIEAIWRRGERGAAVKTPNQMSVAERAEWDAMPVPDRTGRDWVYPLTRAQAAWCDRQGVPYDRSRVEG